MPAAIDGAVAAQPEQWYVGVEAMAWWFKKSPIAVPLLTTADDPTAVPVAPYGDPATRVLLGNDSLGTGTHWGGRITAGLWIEERHEIALEGSYFYTARQTTVRAVSSDGSQILAVPFMDADALAENSFVLASPGTSAGSAVLAISNRLQGAGLQFVVRAGEGERWHLQVMGGFRYLDLVENLTYATNSTGLADPNTDLVLNTVDQFNTRNQFYGCLIGARGDYEIGRLSLGASASVALGEMAQAAAYNGYAVTNYFNGTPGGPFTGVPTQVLPGSGTFVQPSNLGSMSRDQIAWAPEVGLRVSYQLTDHLRVFAGYDLLYLSTVLRPGEQIDRSINVSQTVQSAIAGNAAAPGTRPAMILVGTDFWAQAISLGLDLRF